MRTVSVALDAGLADASLAQVLHQRRHPRLCADDSESRSAITWKIRHPEAIDDGLPPPFGHLLYADSRLQYRVRLRPLEVEDGESLHLLHFDVIGNQELFQMGPGARPSH